MPVSSISLDRRSGGADLWVTAPFDPALAAQVQSLVARLDATQRIWLSGYLIGSAAPGTAAAPAADDASPARVTVLFGSQSGNCEQLARRVSAALEQRGVAHRTLDMLDARKSDLQETDHLLVLVSTHGEGEPPDRAKPLYELLHGRKAPKLGHLKYSVLALGDSSYEKFCETGRQFDAQLEALGAQRLHDRVECDVDFEAPAAAWIEAVVARLAREHASGPSADTGPSAVLASIVPRAAASVMTAYTRKNPFRAPVLVNQRLTARDSSKDVRHIELSIEDAGIHYEPGDALGVVPRNFEQDVDALLEHLTFAADAPVSVAGQTLALRDALIEHLDIGPLTASLVGRYAEAFDVPALRALLDPSRKEELERYLHGRHLIDLVCEHPPRGEDAAGFVQLLRPLAPRLYSIASSPRATPDEVHLTVRVVTYRSHERLRRGVVSAALAQLTGEDDVALVYPHRNTAFRLPEDPHAPIVMIGPGTGVAPFRAFLAERDALGASGKNWLFFGDRSFRSDFLYQVEWLDYRKRGLLTRLDVAFSRDGAEKVYVQHRIRERGRELYAWLQEGASVYLCGDAQRMAPDVERALRDIVREHGGMSEEQAEEYWLQIQRERRYQKDVY